MTAQTNLYKVIIVGGGAAGLSAAQKLIEKGVKKCILLEAQSTLGGRISTVTHGDHCLEYGAHWVHGEDGNVVYAMAKKNNFLDEEKSLKQTGVGQVLFVREDSSILDEEMVEKFEILMANLTEEGEKELSSYKESIGKYYTNKFLEVNKWDSVGLELLNWYERYQCLLDGSNTWFEPSGIGSTVFQECPGNNVINWSKGYKTLIDYFQNDVPEEVIRLNCPVKKIFWKCSEPTSNIPCVKVELLSGETLFGEHVIMTPSLAVLKASYKSLFEPKLPSRKIDAIKGLGIDVVNKIFLEFPSHWWGDCDGFSFLREVPPHHFDQQNWEKAILGFYEVYKHPQMLCAWLAGDSAKEMEKSSDEKVKDKCMTLLKSYLSSHYTIPEPIWWDRTKWRSNPFVKGAYSFRSVTSEAMGVTAKDLAYPLCSDRGVPLVCFAGEATHDIYYSTVHGAVESGWREADRIVAHLSHGDRESSVVPNRRHFDVVIVGAGASGLAAAKELEANGINSIIILEATNRLGGRVKTMVPPSGGFLDIGAQWIHGQRGNMLYETVVPRGMIGERLSVDGGGGFYTDEGEKIDENFVSEVIDVYNNFKEDCRAFSSSQISPPPSFGHFYAARFEEYLNEVGGTSREKQLKKALFHWDVKWERIDNACDSLHQLSAKRWGDYLICDGFFNMNPKYGMVSLLHSIRADFRAEIKFETEVTDIDYAKTVVEKDGIGLTRGDGSKPVIITCRNGERYECNHVIVTCSLGYLKRHKDLLFNPPLPPLLNTAISSLGFGVINKIFLEFEEPFWGPDFTGAHLVWTDEVPDSERSKQDTRLVNGQKLKPEDYWYRAISGFDAVYGHNSMLCGWIGGSEAEFMETLAEEEVARVCVSLLRKFTDYKSIPDPINIYRSRWASDDFFLGSYSYRSNEWDHLETDFVKEINIPVYATGPQTMKVPLVTFAGEANSLHYYSTIHGALSNGASQAKHYIDFTKSFKQRPENGELLKSKL